MTHSHNAASAANTESVGEPWRVCVAPMMDWTDRHCRYFHRLLSPRARLYTEMVTSAALVRGRQLRLLEHRSTSTWAVRPIGCSRAALVPA